MRIKLYFDISFVDDKKTKSIYQHYNSDSIIISFPERILKGEVLKFDNYLNEVNKHNFPEHVFEYLMNGVLFRVYSAVWDCDEHGWIQCVSLTDDEDYI